MQAKELRIGNLVNPLCGELEHIGRVTCILPHDISVELIDENYEEYLSSSQDIDDGYYEPIPLTEEWLLKFGFEVPYEFGASKGEIHLALEHGIYRYYVNSEYWKDIDYVHQLQNLYFALTGEELCIQQVEN